MLKVLHLNSQMKWRGGERQLTFLIEQLKSRDIENITLCPIDSALENFCKKRSYQVSSLYFKNPFNPIFLYDIAKTIKSIKPDIVHLHDAKAHSIAIFADFLFGLNTKFVLHRRVTFPLKTNFISQFKYKYHKIHKIITISEAVKNELLKSEIRPEIIELVYSGVDLNRYKSNRYKKLRQLLNIDDNVKIIGNISALTPEKGLKTFLDTAKILLEKNDNLFFVIAGEGILKQELIEYSKSLGINNQVRFLGFQKTIIGILKNFDVFLFTSENEGLGTSVLDAMACGVPVVSTNAGGIIEIIEHENTGLLSEINDAKSLAENTARIIENVDFAKQLVINAKIKSKQFDTKIMSEKIYEIYKSI